MDFGTIATVVLVLVVVALIGWLLRAASIRQRRHPGDSDYDPHQNRDQWPNS
jgi:hypothetical protein